MAGGFERENMHWVSTLISVHILICMKLLLWKDEQGFPEEQLFNVRVTLDVRCMKGHCGIKCFLTIVQDVGIKKREAEMLGEKTE